MIRREEDRVSLLSQRVEDLQHGIATARAVRFTINILARQVKEAQERVKELEQRVDRLEQEARSKR